MTPTPAPRGVGAELAQVHDRWMLAYARLYQSYQLMDLVCDDHSEHFAALLRDYDEVKGERDEARAEAARLRARLTELEDVAQVEEARRREAAEPSPERMLALMRHGPKRGGRG